MISLRYYNLSLQKDRLVVIDPETFGFLVADISRMTRAILDKRIVPAGFGVTQGEARALVHIASEEGARQTRIAERLGVEPMTACRYIDRLEQLGYVERCVDPDDRRAKNVTTTAAATPLIETTLAQFATIREDALSCLEPDERETMMRGLRKVSANLRDMIALQAAEAAE